jgi:hypothetical protein
MMKSSLTRAATTVAVFAGALGLAVPAASAAVAPAVTASTQLSNRGDSGGNGDWATDAMTRRLVITQTGRSGSTRIFTAAVTDTGRFTTIPRAYTPNQGGADLGLKIAELLQGTFTGKAAYSFTANASPQASLVPRAENGTPSSGPKTTSLWYEQAFPAGTAFGGTGITTWGWNYTATAVTFLRGGGFNLCTQKWSDASTNNGGQDANSGNITGTCPSSFIF